MPSIYIIDDLGAKSIVIKNQVTKRCDYNVDRVGRLHQNTTINDSELKTCA
jgi:hypothetical protein